MRRVAIAVVAVACCFTVIPVSQATASASRPRSTDVCIDAPPLPLNVAKAAAVRIVVGKSKKARPAGMAMAQQLADTISGRNRPSPCEADLTEWDQQTLDEIQALFETGDVETSLQMLGDFIESIPVPDYGENVLSPAMRDASVCPEFRASTLEAPAELTAVIGADKQAQIMGAEGMSQEARKKIDAILESFITSGAGGAATSIGDWLGLAQLDQSLDGPEGLDRLAIAEAVKIAEQAYDAYNLTKCRQSRDVLDCYFRAAMTLELFSEPPATGGRDNEEAIAAAIERNSGINPKTCKERYLFRIQMSWRAEGGGYLRADTGPIYFTTEGGKITSKSKGPLKLGSLSNVTCWSQQADGSWIRDGLGDITGGEFPYKVTGKDQGRLLNLRVIQSGRWTVDASGSTSCDFLFRLGEQVLNSFPLSLSAGLELPAGNRKFAYTSKSSEVSPSGEILTNTVTITMKALESESG